MDSLSQVRSRIAEIQSFFPVPAQTPTPSNGDWPAVAATAGLGESPATGVAGIAAAGDAFGLDASQAAAGTSAGAAGVLAKARNYLGVPYLWGGTDPNKGLDCSGFTQLVYKSQGVDLPRVSSQQATAGRAVGSLAEARPGDLLFFDYSPTRPGIDHVGIYAGDGKMIAAPQPGDVVKIQDAGRPTVIRRVLPDGAV